MASDYQQHHTPPRQSIATSSIHSSAGDLGITITIDIMKVTFVGIRVMTVLKIRGKRKPYKTQYTRNSKYNKEPTSTEKGPQEETQAMKGFGAYSSTLCRSTACAGTMGACSHPLNLYASQLPKYKAPCKPKIYLNVTVQVTSDTKGRRIYIENNFI